MTASMTITDHLLQAALRYVEHGDVNGLQAVLREHPAIVRWRGIVDARGLIHAAAEVGRVDMLSVLMEAGADPNMAEGERIDEEDGPVYQPGYVPLHHAVWGGHEGAVNLLLAHGALATLTDHAGGTPLHTARKLQIAEALLKAGADPNAQCWMRYFDETLGWHFAGRPLHAAAQRGDAAMIHALVTHGAAVDGTDAITARTALHYAAARGEGEAVKVLLEHGADPDAISDEAGYGQKWGHTPLHYSAKEGHEKVVLMLLAAGADSRLLGGAQGQTAGDLASQKDHGGVAKILAMATTFARDSTTRESLKEAARHAPKFASAAKGLEGLFGLKDKGSLRSGPTFDEDTHATGKPDLPLRDADRIKNDIVKLCVDDLRAITEGLQSGDDSGLENIWEEICVQVQGEQSIFWSMYEDLVDTCVTAHVMTLNRDEKIALWLTTDDGLDWSLDQQDDDDGCLVPFSNDAILEELRSCVLSVAEDYENDRIDSYKWGSAEDEATSDEDNSVDHDSRKEDTYDGKEK